MREENTQSASLYSRITSALRTTASYVSPLFKLTFVLSLPQTALGMVPNAYSFTVGGVKYFLTCVDCTAQFDYFRSGVARKLAETVANACAGTGPTTDFIYCGPYDSPCVIKNYGIAQQGDPACNLIYRLYNERGQVNPLSVCVDNATSRNAVNGLPTTCINPENIIWGCVIGGIIAIPALIVLIVYIRERRRRFLPAAQPANHHFFQPVPPEPIDIPSAAADRFETMSEKLNALRKKINAENTELMNEFDKLEKDFNTFEEKNCCVITQRIMTDPAGLHEPQTLHFFEMNALLSIDNQQCPIDRRPFDPNALKVDENKRNEITTELDALSSQLDAFEAKVFRLAPLDEALSIGNDEPVAESTGDVEMEEVVTRRLSL